MNNRTIPNRAGRHGFGFEPNGEHATHGLGAFLIYGMDRGQLDQLAVDPRDQADFGITQFLRARSDDIEQGLYVSGRSADEPVTIGSLHILSTFPQLSTPSELDGMTRVRGKQSVKPTVYSTITALKAGIRPLDGAADAAKHEQPLLMRPNEALTVVTAGA